jgi:hypothetical protein
MIQRLTIFIGFTFLAAAMFGTFGHELALLITDDGRLYARWVFPVLKLILIFALSGTIAALLISRSRLFSRLPSSCSGCPWIGWGVALILLVPTGLATLGYYDVPITSDLVQGPFYRFYRLPVLLILSIGCVKVLLSASSEAAAPAK